MKKNNFIITVILSAALLGYGSPIPVETIIKKPEITNVSLSYDGKCVAALYIDDTDQKQLLTWILKKNDKNLLSHEISDYDIYHYEWASNSHLLYYTNEIKLVRQYLASADLRLINLKKLVQTREVYVINSLIYDPDNVLVIKRVTTNWSRIGLLNIHKQRELVKDSEKNLPGRVIRWLTDLSGDLRFVAAYKKGDEKFFHEYYRESMDKPWKEVDVKYHSLESFTPDGKKMYVSTYYWPEGTSPNKTRALCVYDVKNDKLDQTVFSDSVFDFFDNSKKNHGELHFYSNLHVFEHNLNTPSKNKLWGVTFYNDSAFTYWFDDRLKSIQSKIDKKLPMTINTIYDADTSLTQLLIQSYSDIKPADYYLYDSKLDSLKLLYTSRPWIKPELMCKTKAVKFTTRDSLQLHAYLTLPKNGNAPYPTILLIHGGPWVRDYWEFNDEVQFLASRGYAVFQINYRGSKGYGYKISKKYEDYFYHMHCDIIDGTIYLIEEGIADRKRIALMGASFGGYLSICCVANAPKLYKCAISNAGVFDWKGHIKSKKIKGLNLQHDLLESMIGGKENSEFLKKISPINIASNIKVPVFIAAGGKDMRVPFSQSLKMEKVLKKAGVKVETFYRKWETHGFWHNKNRIKYYNKVLNFLEKNMSKTK